MLRRQEPDLQVPEKKIKILSKRPRIGGAARKHGHAKVSHANVESPRTRSDGTRGAAKGFRPPLTRQRQKPPASCRRRCSKRRTVGRVRRVTSRVTVVSAGATEFLVGRSSGESNSQESPRSPQQR